MVWLERGRIGRLDLFNEIMFFFSSFALIDVTFLQLCVYMCVLCIVCLSIGLVQYLLRARGCYAGLAWRSIAYP